GDVEVRLLGGAPGPPRGPGVARVAPGETAVLVAPGHRFSPVLNRRRSGKSAGARETTSPTRSLQAFLDQLKTSTWPPPCTSFATSVSSSKASSAANRSAGVATATRAG